MLRALLLVTLGAYAVVLIDQSLSALFHKSGSHVVGPMTLAAAVPNEGNSESSTTTWPMHECRVSYDVWASYVTGTSEILLVNQLTTEISELLSKEQTLIKEVLSYQVVEEASEDIDFEAKLAEVKKMLLSDETKVASAESSQEMVISAESVVGNLTLSDLTLRTDSLQQIIDRWTRESTEMNSSGAVGKRRSANFKYLKVLQDVVDRLKDIRAGVKKVADDSLAKSVERKAILEKWQIFEKEDLPILDEYVQSNIVERILPSADGKYIVPNRKDVVWLYSCTISNRRLYFSLSSKSHEKHPFKLVDLGRIE